MEAQFEKAKMITDMEGTWLAIKLPRNTILYFLEWMKQKVYTCIIKEYQKKRSLDANAYMWRLLGKLAPEVGSTPEDVYRQILRDIGGNYEVFPVRNDIADRFPAIWEADHIGWFAECLGPSKHEGYTNFRCYYGSSVYDTKQMSRLIDFVTEACKENGVETLSEMELSRLKEEWH